MSRYKPQWKSCLHISLYLYKKMQFVKLTFVVINAANYLILFTKYAIKTSNSHNYDALLLSLLHLTTNVLASLCCVHEVIASKASNHCLKRKLLEKVLGSCPN